MPERQNWVKEGLIFAPPNNLAWMRTHAAVPVAQRVGANRYRIYFSGRDDRNRSQTGFVEIDITAPHRVLSASESPVLQTGALGAFDDSGAMLSWIVDQGDDKYLYYIGWNLGVTVPFRNSVGLAISRDGGLTATRYSKAPVLDRNDCDPYFVASMCILIENGVWRMWYVSCAGWELENAKPKHHYHIKYAESEDGVQWRREGVVCIDFKSEAEYAISRPCVLKEGSIYRMWYSYRGHHYRIGYAESGDGIRWERKDHLVALDVSESGWDSEMVEYPCVFYHKDQLYMLYNGNDYGKSGIGLALLDKAC